MTYVEEHMQYRDSMGLTFSYARSGGVTLRDGFGDRLGHAGGGGYDKTGTALAQFVNQNFQPELLKLHRKAWYPYSIDAKGNYHRLKRGAWATPETCPRCKNGAKYHDGTHARDVGCIYGTSAYYTRGNRKPSVFTIDGACGFREVESLLARIGLKLERVAETKTTTTYTLRGFDKLMQKRANAAANLEQVQA